jgi:hypothetical protein
MAVVELVVLAIIDGGVLDVPAECVIRSYEVILLLL